MAEHIHTFAGNPLDRAEALRRDEAGIADLAQRADTLYLPFHRLEVAVGADQGLDWRTGGALRECRQTVFLGMHDETARFAADLTEPLADAQFQDCRTIAAQLSVEDTGILAQARAQLDWHYRNPFCAQCGHPTRAERGGQIRRCTHCDKHIFPRTDPVAIMLIIDRPGGDRCLLGKSAGRMANTKFYSALAGFLDQGESLEEAVRREVREEAGIIVGEVAYHSSQPWPFPSQLMIGCHGIAETHDIQIDAVEMADVRWFTREEARAAIAQTNPDLRVPGALAIAHHLIRSWVEGEVVL